MDNKIYFCIIPNDYSTKYGIQVYSTAEHGQKESLYIKEFTLNISKNYIDSLGKLISNYDLNTEEKLKRFKLDTDIIKGNITKSEYDVQLCSLFFNSMKNFINEDITNYINIIKIENAEDYI